MNLTKRFLVLVILVVSFINSNAQQKTWIFFSDKEDVTFDPYEYFDAKAIERRIAQNIPLSDFTDLPVNIDYINDVSEIADSISFVSRWFNAVSIYTSTNEQLQMIVALKFVDSFAPVQAPIINLSGGTLSEDLSNKDSMLLVKQIRRLGGELFHDKKISGKGVRIAIFDAGFPTVKTNPVFEKIVTENRIIAAKDFSRNRKDPYYGNKHGTMVMACIGGKYEGIKIGLAPDAEFLLAKTEVKGEPRSEEENWLEAVEWADKNGAEIINSSLGYTYHRYFTNQMDGKTSLVARAANMAARKGILVVNALGNDGDSKWHTLGTPADADSVLSVGGISPALDYRINFSSYGPTSDNRLKPNVSAYGKVLTIDKSGPTTAYGTSFASPLVAGFAACVKQMHPEYSVMELFREIERSGHLYPYFDYSHGYGIPQAGYFLKETLKDNKAVFEIVVENSTIKIKFGKNLPVKDKLLFYHIENKEGLLRKYYVIEISDIDELTLPDDKYQSGEILRVHFSGYTGVYKF